MPLKLDAKGKALLKVITGVSAVSLSYSALNFLANIFISRKLGTEAFAAYSLYTAVCTFSALVCSGGFDAISMRSSNNEEMRHNTKQANISILALSFLFVGPLAIYLYTQGANLNVTLLVAYSASVYFLAHNTFKQGIAAYINAQARYQALEKLGRAAFFLIFLLPLPLFAHSNVNASIYAFCFALLLSFVLTNAFLYRFEHPPLLFDRKIDKTLLGPSLLLMASGVLINLLTTLDLVAIGHMGSAVDIAMYSAAQKLSIFSSVITYAINIAVMPALLRHRREQNNKDSDVVRQAIVVAILCSGLYLVVCIFFGKHLLALFGPEYSGAYGILVLLATANLVSVGFGQTYTLMRIHNQERQLALFILAAVFVKIVFIGTLYQSKGIYAAAWGTVASAAVWNALCYLYLLKKLGVNSMARGSN